MAIVTVPARPRHSPLNNRGSRASRSSFAIGGCDVLVRFESRLTTPLKRASTILAEGQWCNEPPLEIKAQSVAVLGAESATAFSGVRGSVQYRYRRGTREVVLNIDFERRRVGAQSAIRCWEEDAEPAGGDGAGGVGGTSRRMFVIRMGGVGGAGAASIVVELANTRHGVHGASRRLSVEAGPTSATMSLASGQLAMILRQATRSVLIRIVNLTRRALILESGDDMLSDMVNTVGFWIQRPTDRIAPGGFADLGVTGHGFLMGLRGEFAYTLEAPHSTEEERVRVHIQWQCPWVGRRRIVASDRANLFVVQANCDAQNNLAGAVHIMDPHDLPRLELLSAVAMMSELDMGQSTDAATDVSKLIRPYLISPHELHIPSVRALLAAANQSVSRGDRGSVTTADSASRMRAATVLRLKYRIGPEVFRREFAPTSAANVSTAMAGGGASIATILDSVADLKAEGGSGWGGGAAVGAADTLGSELQLPERALALQTTMTTAASPIVCQQLQEVRGSDWPSSRSLLKSPLSPGLKRGGTLSPAAHDKDKVEAAVHLWPAPGAAAATATSSESLAAAASAGLFTLDAEGLLAALRVVWTRFPAASAVGPVDTVLAPLRDVVTTWAEQEELDDASLDAACAAASAVLRVLDREDAAAEVESLSRSQPQRVPPCGGGGGGGGVGGKEERRRRVRMCRSIRE